MLDRYKEWKYDWEPKHARDDRATSSSATPSRTSRRILKELGEGCGTRFEFECYDVGHLYNLAHFLDRGLVKPPLFVQTIFGILGGIGADPENLVHMKRIADKLFGDDYAWSILAAGRHQMPLVTMGAIMGGNVRVGLEDSLYARPRPAGREQRRAGQPHPHDPGGPVAGDRHAGRGARDARR